MKHYSLLLLLTVNICLGQNYKFINGQWFNGSSFESATWFTVQGLLTKIEPIKVDSIINLGNSFVIPPYGEAHNHNVMPGPHFRELNSKYLKDGIFFVKNPCSLNETKVDLQKNNLIGTPLSIDVSFANGGITGTNGHPFRFFEPSSPRGEGNFYYFVNSQQQFETKWPGILKNKPDFIKTFLFFSEEFDQRKDDIRYEGFRGIDPSLLPIIVKAAHKEGLRVSTHIETSMDFHNAIKAGVDEVNHMPGFRGDPMRGMEPPKKGFKIFVISEEDARIAAANGTVVVTTIGDTQFLPIIYRSTRNMADKLHKANLETLKRFNVKIAFGSDSYERNSLIEINYLKERNVFTNQEILKMLCETTPETIFPTRKIAKLMEGYEASFLVLSLNPLNDIKSVTRIKHWIKQGIFLDALLNRDSEQGKIKK